MARSRPACTLAASCGSAKRAQARFPDEPWGVMESSHAALKLDAMDNSEIGVFIQTPANVKPATVAAMRWAVCKRCAKRFDGGLSVQPPEPGALETSVLQQLQDCLLVGIGLGQDGGSGLLDDLCARELAGGLGVVGVQNAAARLGGVL